ncbi:MAG: SDR family NAD(P)-dependent oxidoreductase [Bacteroidetes bacterium]|nr:MAG: SDR family NAD(P)-dependent oxidoreductase [Bacteroidota bacterium]TAG88360.1 MAG: SDR family NAD(P)-dependent oxidoreductase [Bacteroidota bacterium]
MKITLITGATSGIGKATAEHLASLQYPLILCGRRQERLNELTEKLSKLTKIYTLNFDVRDKKEVQKAIDSLPNEWKNIEVLINNAGNAHGLSTIQEGDVEDWDLMLDINVKGLLYVSKAIMPMMIAQEKGHIINIGSLAGKEVYPRGNVYCASKYAVDALTQGMRIDLNAHGIKVSGINPGLVETEFSLVRFKGNAERAAQTYQNFQPLMPQDIAEIIAFTISRPLHVNLADILVLPNAQASATVVKKNQ